VCKGRVEAFDSIDGQNRQERNERALNQAIAVGEQTRHELLAQGRLHIGLELLDQTGESIDGVPVDALDLARGVVQTLEHGVGGREEAYELLGSGGGISRAEFARDGGHRCLQVGDERLAPLPVDEAARPLEGGEATANDSHDRLWPLGAGKSRRDNALKA
jgi:hypothetical protein